MRSCMDIFKIGFGPSSSHTMGPRKAAQIFGGKHGKDPKLAGFEVTLFGSLAATGKGHLTDKAIIDALAPITPNIEIVWKPDVFLPPHPNGLRFRALSADKSETLDSWTVYSIGGGSLSESGSPLPDPKKDKVVYEHSTMNEIMAYCEKKGLQYWQYVEQRENKAELWDHLGQCWSTMKQAVEKGLLTEGVLPGLNLPRKASSYYVKSKGFKQSLVSRGLIFSYALAVAEENASGANIVTAPTCGSSGVIPACLYHLYDSYKFSQDKLLKALATAALFGNVVRTNASISGADVGCQGEIGTAASMAAAAVSQLFGLSIQQIEYAAELGLEHHLGLTCDPVCGLVQVPCIERNAFSAVRAFDCNLFASLGTGTHLVSFDTVVRAMKQTGHDLPSLYKETSLGGLAKYAHEEIMKRMA